MINSFRGDYRFLSNFSPARVVFEGLEYKTTEAAYQAAKTTDPLLKRGLAVVADPKTAKQVGKLLKCRPDWNDIRVQVMSRLIELKFAEGTELAQKLVDTFPHELVEGNHWNDTFWGVCNGVGENWLGRVLMRRRMELMARGLRVSSEEIARRESVSGVQGTDAASEATLATC